MALNKWKFNKKIAEQITEQNANLDMLDTEISNLSMFTRGKTLPKTTTADGGFWHNLQPGTYFLNKDIIPNQPTSYGVILHMKAGSDNVTLYIGLGIPTDLYIRTGTSMADRGFTKIG